VPWLLAESGTDKEPREIVGPFATTGDTEAWRETVPENPERLCIRIFEIADPPWLTPTPTPTNMGDGLAKIAYSPTIMICVFVVLSPLVDVVVSTIV